MAVKQATPNNKKDGKTYLTKNFSKEQLVDRCAEQEGLLAESKIKFEELQKEYNNLKKEYSNLQKKYNRVTVKEEIVKNILELKARNLVPIDILKKMNLRGFNVSLEEIKVIYNGDLTLDMEVYYNDCVAKYIETIKINTKYYKQSSIEETNKLLGYSYENLEACESDDIKLRQEIIKSISELIAKRDNLMKNIDETSEMTEEDEALAETTDTFKSLSDNIIRVNFSKVKQIGEA